MPRLGIVNGHPSLLPRYRGPFPIAWAVRNGETEIGMSFHLMDAAFDTGNVLAQKAIPLDDDDTDETLFGGSRRWSTSCCRSSSSARCRRPRRAPGGRRVPEHVRGRYWTIDPSQPAGRGAPPGARLELRPAGHAGPRADPRARRRARPRHAHEPDRGRRRGACSSAPTGRSGSSSRCRSNRRSGRSFR